MNFELPSHARVQIFVLPPSAQPLPETPALPQPATLQSRPRHRLLKGTAVLALVGCAYVVGQHAAPRGGADQPAYAQDLRPAPYVPPLPQRSSATAVAPSTAGEVPAAFREQLQQRPSVTPTPGAPPAATPGKSLFGLED
jgi:hypothetical protein